MIGRGSRSTRRKPAPVPLCPQQSPHAARTRTRVAAVGSQRLTAELRHGPLVAVSFSFSLHILCQLFYSSSMYFCLYLVRTGLCCCQANECNGIVNNG
jgi:hypothetical protein